MTALEDAQAVLGTTAILSLGARGLLPTRTGGTAGVVPADRAAGMLRCVAIGNALGVVAGPPLQRGDDDWSARTSAALRVRLGGPAPTLGEAHLAHWSAKAWATAGWAGPESLSDRIGRRVDRVRAPGRAVLATAAARNNGAPWFEAGVGSFGNGAATRAFAPAIRFGGDPESRTLAAALDAAATHATPLATAGAAFLADVAVGLAVRGPGVTVADVIRREVARTDGLLRDHLIAGLAAPLDHRALESLGLHPSLPSTLAVLCCVLTQIDDPARALAALATVDGDADTIAAIGGGLLGAAHGMAWIPRHWRHVERAGRLERAAGRLLDAARLVVDGRVATEATATDGNGPAPETGDPHLWFLLDRSGSMQSIAADVEGGFDSFFADQRQDRVGLTTTVVQFDSGDVHDVLVDRRPLGEVPSMIGRFEPRGMTPLYDAIARLLDVAEAANVHPADQLVVIFTDGHENSSVITSDVVHARIDRLRAAGWTFVFLGANQDSFAVASQLGMAARSGRNVRADRDGIRTMYAEASHATGNWKTRSRGMRVAQRDELWDELNQPRERG